MNQLDKFRGCLIGGAAGDALGYAVEFWSAKDIFSRYGRQGIESYTLTNGIAQISDDTQMTLFTANGLLMKATQEMRGISGDYLSYIWLCYIDWLNTQTSDDFEKEEAHISWLYNIPQLHSNREPGHTCIDALIGGVPGNIQTPINQSKGCGGIMRVAPIALYFQGEQYSAATAARIGAEVAALTHGHELGYLSAAALVHMIHTMIHEPDRTMIQATQDAMLALPDLFPSAAHLEQLLKLMQQAINLSSEKRDDLEAIRALGQGWVAEETLAIALYCALKYERDFDKALIAAVNHDGDSDSTGAVTGNLLGAYLGIHAIPQKYLEHLELKKIILEIADDLFYDCSISEYNSGLDPVWVAKYIKADYIPLQD